MEKETIKKEMAAVGFMLAGCVVFALGLNLFEIGRASCRERVLCSV